MEREELRKQLMKLRRESIIQGFMEAHNVDADAVLDAALRRELELEEKQYRKASEKMMKLLPGQNATLTQINNYGRALAVERRYANSCVRLHKRIIGEKSP